MTEFDRRHMLTALAAGGLASLGARTAASASRDLDIAEMKKETDVACLYHCDFGDDRRYSDMLRNIHNHLSVYDFDPFQVKIVIVAHSGGIKYHLKTVQGTTWAQSPPDPELDQRMQALAGHGVEVYLCKLTFERQKLDLSFAKDVPYVRLVPSGVATAAALQGKGFAYLKVG